MSAGRQGGVGATSRRWLWTTRWLVEAAGESTGRGSGVRGEHQGWVSVGASEGSDGGGGAMPKPVGVRRRRGRAPTGGGAGEDRMG